VHRLCCACVDKLQRALINLRESPTFSSCTRWCALQVVWQTVRPHNQEALTAEQLDEDVPKVLVGLCSSSAQLPGLRRQ
jgi:hypothetical protein